MTTTIITYANKSVANNVIDKLNSAIYFFSHGEYERPHYTVRKMRGQATYYIHARRHYYAGTLFATPSGPVCETR